MAGIATAVGVLGSIASFAGTIASVGAQQQQAKALENQGIAEQQIAAYNAKVARQQAQQERAVAQRKSFEERRKKNRALSQIQARAAYSGGGAADPNILDLSADVAAQGEYNALAQMYSGESRARGLEDQASLDIYTGNARAGAYRDRASIARSRSTATLIGGFGGLAGNLARFA